jgi:hypothetical protein
LLSRPGTDDPNRLTIDPIAGPDALAVDAVGLLSSDLVAGMTGLTVPSFSPSGEAKWRDRAALHAAVWEGSQRDPETGLRAEFDAEARPPVGYTVFNSMDSATNCKVLISQIDVADREDNGDADTCAGIGAEVSNTVDLLDYLGEECASGFTWATAALISARFPFVSPSARVSGTTVPDTCSAGWDMQLLDGGLIDNSALGTTSDLLAELAVLIREENASDASRGLVIPVVLFAANEPGADVVRDASQTRPELFAPLAAMDGAQAVLASPSAWLTRLSQTLDDVCGGSGDVYASCRNAVEALRTDLPGSIVVVSPSTTPAITVPLGWSLSAFSRSRLRVESDQQRRCGRNAAFVDHEYDFTSSAEALTADQPACKASGDYGRYGTFLNFFDDIHAEGRQ